LREAGVKSICAGKKDRWDLLGFFFRLLATFRDLRPDVIHSYLHESNLMALLLKPLCGFPKVIWGIRDSQTDADTWGSRLKRDGYFNAAPIRQKWQEHLSGTRNWHFYLWDILMFQAWLQAQR
jgi:hypothetical protein